MPDWRGLRRTGLPSSFRRAHFGTPRASVGNHAHEDRSPDDTGRPEPQPQAGHPHHRGSRTTRWRNNPQRVDREREQIGILLKGRRLTTALPASTLMVAMRQTRTINHAQLAEEHCEMSTEVRAKVESILKDPNFPTRESRTRGCASCTPTARPRSARAPLQSCC